ncbi:MAG: ORF6N domain-containing protein [Bacteroidetes bacterium]|nr:MAG: ORF6N domain-containing protein [Bacteroidota bacterium]REK31955.1 MAG: ORF6N domain-containing protein [Bacteroidota bacterium]REK50020.1 MAG: ORF6N domain-containing protein [Bacteroidota bacterium]
MKNLTEFRIKDKIHELRNTRVILDFDIAELYEVPTKVLNQAVRRNMERFPEDFMFQLSEEEWQILRSQIVTSSWGGKRYLPYAFTEYGVAMLSGVLRSDTAIRMNIVIVRAFIALRKMALEHQDLKTKILDLEKQCNIKFNNLEHALEYLIIEKEQAEEQKNRKRIGFKNSASELINKQTIDDTY